MKHQKSWKRAGSLLLALLLGCGMLQPSAYALTDVQPAASPSITEQAAEAASALAVTLTTADGGAVSAGGYRYKSGDRAVTLRAQVEPKQTECTYQWYRWSGKNAYVPVVSEGTNLQTYTLPTTENGTTGYFCMAVCTVDGKRDEVKSPTVVVTVSATAAQPPEISTQPQSAVYLARTSTVTALNVGAKASDGGTLTYQWYSSSDGARYTAVEGGTGASYQPAAPDGEAKISYYCEVTNTVTGETGAIYTAKRQSDVAVLRFQGASAIGGNWPGADTAENPFQLADAAALTTLSKLATEQGIPFNNYCFKMTADITLPADWVPIGAMPGKNGSGKSPFSGLIDGDGHTLTIPEGGLPLLGCVRGAAVRNLNIFGKKIAGHGLVNHYIVDYGPTGNYWAYTSAGYPTTIDIDRVTLKSGSSTLGSGLIGGYASGANVVHISNSVIEEGVVIGYDGEQSQIGSFGGAFNGSLDNCVSYAEVYGKDFVGGLIGGKGQAMGSCSVRDSAFYGTVTASGNYAGGIIGGGYAAASAPNTPCVTVENCLVTGKITGQDYVGGILGAEPACKQCWANGIGYLQNNLFAGTLDVTGSGAYVGGIVGGMKSLDRYNIIANNYYLDSAASAGIGGVDEVDTKSSGYGRSDNPTGADADTLAKAVTAAQLADGTACRLLNTGLNSSGNWVQAGAMPGFGDKVHLSVLQVSGYTTSYHQGDVLDTKNMGLTAVYSDGSVRELSPKDVIFRGFDSITTGTKDVTVLYDNHFAVMSVSVYAGTASQSGDTITVSFSLLGDDAHGEQSGTHTLRDGGLMTWIGKADYTVDADATVRDVFEKALRKNGVSWTNPSGNYIDSITSNGVRLSEFTNGRNSGWMYTLNGVHPQNGVAEQKLSNGDEIVFHYTDDYTKEQGSEQWNTNEQYYDKTMELKGTRIGTTAVAALSAAQIDLLQQKTIKNLYVKVTDTAGADKLIFTLLQDTLPILCGSDTSLHVQADTVGSITLNHAALMAAKERNAATTQLVMERGTGFGLVSAAQIAEHPVYEVSLLTDGVDVSALSGSAVLTLPYTPNARENPAKLTVDALCEDGSLQSVTDAAYQPESKGVVVTTDTLGAFAVRYDQSRQIIFSDVPNGHWAKTAIDALTQRDIACGDTYTTFAPDKKITRAEFTALLFRLSGDSLPGEKTAFADVRSSDWYADCVAWAVQHQIAAGESETRFAPDAPMIRQDMAVMALRYAEYKGLQTDDAGQKTTFVDGTEISDYAQNAVAVLSGLGVIHGKENSRFDPLDNTTRAESACLIDALSQRLTA